MDPERSQIQIISIILFLVFHYFSNRHALPRRFAFWLSFQKLLNFEDFFRRRSIFDVHVGPRTTGEFERGGQSNGRRNCSDLRPERLKGITVED